MVVIKRTSSFVRRIGNNLRHRERRSLQFSRMVRTAAWYQLLVEVNRSPVAARYLRTSFLRKRTRLTFSWLSIAAQRSINLTPILTTVILRSMLRRLAFEQRWTSHGEHECWGHTGFFGIGMFYIAVFGALAMSAQIESRLTRCFGCNLDRYCSRCSPTVAVSDVANDVVCKR